MAMNDKAARELRDGEAVMLCVVFNQEPDGLTVAVDVRSEVDGDPILLNGYTLGRMHGAAANAMAEHFMELAGKCGPSVLVGFVAGNEEATGPAVEKWVTTKRPDDET